MQSWLKTQAPSDATGLASLLSSVVSGNLTSKVDTSKLDKEVFEHPERYTAEEKAAVLLDLQNAQKLVVDGANAGMWGDDYGKVSIANRSGAFWEPDKVLQDINDHISLLQKDPETAEFLEKSSADAMKSLLRHHSGPQGGGHQNLRRPDQVRKSSRRGLGRRHEGRQKPTDCRADQLLRYSAKSAIDAGHQQRGGYPSAVASPLMATR